MDFDEFKDQIKDKMYFGGFYLSKFRDNQISAGICKIKKIVDPLKDEQVLQRLQFTAATYSALPWKPIAALVSSVVGIIPDLVLLVFSEYNQYRTKEETLVKEAEKRWPRFISKKKFSLKDISKEYVPRGQEKYKISKILQKAIKTDNTFIDEVKVSSRAHTQLIDELLNHRKEIQANKIKTRISFLNYEKRLEELLNKEVEKRKSQEDELKPLLETGINFDYFIPDGKKDFIMNLFRLGITTKKLAKIEKFAEHSLEVNIYNTQEPSFRGLTVDDKTAVFSVFQKYWPGTTSETAITSNEKTIKEGVFHEMNSLRLETVDLSKMSSDIFKRLSYEVDNLDPGKKNFHYIRKFIKNPVIDFSEWEWWENVWSKLAAQELHAMHYFSERNNPKRKN